MEMKFDFTTEEERKMIITQQEAQGFRLKEEQYHIDGKHLIFTNEPVPIPIPQRDLPSEINELKARITTLESMVSKTP